MRRAGAALCCGPRASRETWALERPGSVAVAPGLHVASRHVGTSLDQGSNPCPCTGRWTLNHCISGKPLKTCGFCLPECLFSAPSVQLGVSALNGSWSPVSTPATSSVAWRGPRAQHPCLKPVASPVPRGCCPDLTQAASAHALPSAWKALPPTAAPGPPGPRPAMEQPQLRCLPPALARRQSRFLCSVPAPRKTSPVL